MYYGKALNITKKRSNERVKKMYRTRIWDTGGRNAEQTQAFT